MFSASLESLLSWPFVRMESKNLCFFILNMLHPWQLFLLRGVPASLKFPTICCRVRVNLVSSQESFHAFMSPDCHWSSWVFWHDVNKILRECFQWLTWRAAEDLLTVLPAAVKGSYLSCFAASSSVRQEPQNAQAFTGPGEGSGGETCAGMWFLAEFSNILQWARGTCLSQRDSCLLWRCFCLSHNLSSVYSCKHNMRVMVWHPGSTGWLWKTLKPHPQSLCLCQ